MDRWLNIETISQDGSSQMPEMPKVLGVEPKDLEYINILARHISLSLRELDDNQESEDHVQNMNNIALDNNLKKIKSNTFNKENQKFM